jgi:16S rRNA (adenine1518-N6/adenine1519-N6)-dimethyltransferase
VGDHVTDPRAALARLEQRARKRFGQHFLHDAATVARIVRGAEVRPGDRVVEIGPGLGILTRALLGAGASLLAVELDRDMAAFLREELPALNLVEADAMHVDWATLCPGSGWSVVSNLPYNVGTHVVMALLRQPATFRRVTVMLQREVVARLVAEPGTDAWGALSVEAQARATGRVFLEVPPHLFFPPPKVVSQVVRLDLRPEPLVGGVPPDFFDAVVRGAFTHRRKTLANSLAARFPRAIAEAALAEAAIDPGRRAETLDLSAFQRLAAAIFRRAPGAVVRAPDA